MEGQNPGLRPPCEQLDQTSPDMVVQAKGTLMSKETSEQQKKNCL